MQPVKIAIVDDQILFRQGVATLLKSTGEFELIMEACDAKDCLAQLNEIPVYPDILLLDLEMNGMNGIELNRILQKQYPAIKILVLSIHNKDKLIAKMIESGVSGYLIKNCDKNELTTALLNIYKNGFYIDYKVLKAIQNASLQKNKLANHFSRSDTSLSGREKEILYLICKEYNSSEIADKLFINSRTVEGHRNNLLGKTGCRNTAGLVLFAIKYNFFNIDL
jgi:DNA-binding NarL/FixJ family response regulator